MLAACGTAVATAVAHASGSGVVVALSVALACLEFGLLTVAFNEPTSRVVFRNMQTVERRDSEVGIGAIESGGTGVAASGPDPGPETMLWVQRPPRRLALGLACLTAGIFLGTGLVFNGVLVSGNLSVAVIMIGSAGAYGFSLLGTAALWRICARLFFVDEHRRVLVFAALGTGLILLGYTLEVVAMYGVGAEGGALAASIFSNLGHILVVAFGDKDEHQAYTMAHCCDDPDDPNFARLDDEGDAGGDGGNDGGDGGNDGGDGGNDGGDGGNDGGVGGAGVSDDRDSAGGDSDADVGDAR